VLKKDDFVQFQASQNKKLSHTFVLVKHIFNRYRGS